MLPRSPVLVFAALLLAMPVAAKDDSAADEELLRSAGQPVDGRGLLEFFRRRSLRALDREQVAKWIQQLGDDDFEVREKASQELVAVGVPARELLTEAVRSPDLERAARARRCLKQLKKAATPEVVAAAARQLARKRPVGATAVLLAAVPGVEGAEATEAVTGALAVLGFREGRPNPALLAAVHDHSGARRAAAAEVLCRAGGRAERRAVRPLLTDDDLQVRRRAAVALLEARDKEAIPVLIELVDLLPLNQGWPLEERLLLVAGESAPQVALDDSHTARRKWRDAWRGWWKRHGDELDLAKVDWTRRLLGYTLIVESNRVREVDASGKVRWSINGLLRPTDARVVGKDRVLIAEGRGGNVSERTFDNKVLWRKTVPGTVIALDRQRDGTTFIATRNRIVEFDRDGKEILSLSLPRVIPTAACRLRDGQFLVANRLGQVMRVDRTGKEVRSVALGVRLMYGSRIQPLPGGHFLMPLYYDNRVVEFDADGKAVWEVPAVRPMSAQRLPNGHVLITSRYTRVVEVDRAGKEVWSARDASMPIRAWRR